LSSFSEEKLFHILDRKEEKTMKPSSRLPAIILISIFLIMGQLGCAHTPKVEPPPPTLAEEAKAELGTIGVVPASFLPAFTNEKPMTKEKAAATSARAGALGCLQVGASALQTTIPDMITFSVGLAAIALTPVGAAVGGIVGLVRGVNEAAINDAESVLNLALNDVDIQRSLRDRLLSIAQEKTPYLFVPLDDQGPSSPEEEVSYRSRIPAEVDTILEPSILQFGLSSFSDGPGINPPLSLFVMTRVRVVRVCDDKLLYAHTFHYESKEKRKFTKWAENEGQPLKDGLQRYFDSLPGEIVTTVFGLPGT
jgi:hypothetical protein